MITLAQRVRDFRYSKGWGPDELASRAEISRTALYQIESGKTGLPRAGTLRRIAMALDVSMDDLLGHAEPASGHATRPSVDHPSVSCAVETWVIGCHRRGGPLALPPGAQPSLSHYGALDQDRADDARFGVEPQRRSGATSTRAS